jgi:hypothetical protein
MDTQYIGFSMNRATSTSTGDWHKTLHPNRNRTSLPLLLLPSVKDFEHCRRFSKFRLFKFSDSTALRGAIHQFLSIILILRILVLLPVSTLPYVVKVKSYSLIGE